MNWQKFIHRMRAYRGAWWLEPALPVILAALLTLILTFLVTSGTKRDRLSSAVESIFIKKSVHYVAHHASYKEEKDLLVVSATKEDIKQFGTSKIGFLSDVPLELYARTAERALQEGAERVYVMWLPSAHQVTYEYLRPLIALQKKFPKQRLYIGYQVEELQNVDREVTRALKFLEADDCGRDVQTLCSYNPEWKKWIIQHLVDVYAPEEFSNPENNYISTYLPHFRPNFIMNLVPKSVLPTLNMGSFLASEESHSLEGKAVFIGPDYTFPHLRRASRDLVGRTFTALDDVNVSIAVGGTPFHVMWAQFVGMLKVRHYIKVMPAVWTRTLAVLFCVMILVILVNLGAVFALGFYLFVAVGLPITNVLFLWFFHTYVPNFEIIYSGLMVLLFCSMGSLSFQTYQKWRYDQLAKVHGETADLRKNFVAVVSHNLNTPIAQMQGLVDILAASEKDVDRSALLKLASSDISLMQLFVRSVLTRSSLESGILSEQAVSIRKFVEEFRQSTARTLQKLGFSLELRFDEDDEWSDVPFPLDIRIFSHFIANIYTMIFLKFGRASDTLLLRHDGDAGILELEFSSHPETEKLIVDVFESAFAKDDNLLFSVFAQLITGYASIKGLNIVRSEERLLVRISTEAI